MVHQYNQVIIVFCNRLVDFDLTIPLIPIDEEYNPQSTSSPIPNDGEFVVEGQDSLVPIEGEFSTESTPISPSVINHSVLPEEEIEQGISNTEEERNRICTTLIHCMVKVAPNCWSFPELRTTKNLIVSVRISNFYFLDEYVVSYLLA